jgi:hypothetical protein
VDPLLSHFYTKGLLEREILFDGNGRPYTETDNTYNLADASGGFASVDPQSTTATGKIRDRTIFF